MAEALALVEARLEETQEAHDPSGAGDAHAEFNSRFLSQCKTRVAHFSFVLDSLEHHVSGLPMGPERTRSEGLVREIEESLEQMSSLIEGMPDGESTESSSEVDMRNLHLESVSTSIRNKINELALAHPEKVLPNIAAFEHIRPVVEGMMRNVAQMLRDSVRTLPPEALSGGQRLLHALENAGKGMRSNLKLADAEADLQAKVLLPLTAALLGVGQAKLDGAGPNFRRGLAKAMGKHIAGALKLNQGGPAASERLATRIEEALGGIVTARPVGRRDLNVELKPDAKGKLSTQDFVKALDDTLGWVEKKSRMNVVRLATEMVLKASEEINLEGPAAKSEARNRKHAALKPELAARLEELRSNAGAAPNLAPAQRATEVGMHVSKQLSLSLLKLSLLQSFSHELVEEREKADEMLHPVHPGLAEGKADLLDLTMEHLMDCSDQEEMLEVVSDARETHRQLLQQQRIPAHEGHSGTVLDELEEAITKHGS